MNPTAEQIVDAVIGKITGYENPFSVEQVMQKFAFDVRLPQEVFDATTNESTWAQSIVPAKFITMSNARLRVDVDDFMIPKRPLGSFEDLLAAWNETNYTATERQIDSIEVYESDNIYESENVYRSLDSHNSKHIVFCDSVNDSEYVIASQRSHSSSYCARIEDSKECSESFAISWSGKVVNSAFIHDCYDVYECLMCSHIASKQFCIANMQFEEGEYYAIKKWIMGWILAS